MPHNIEFIIMKRLIPILLSVLCLSSCLNTQSHYTPEIAMSMMVTTSGDTLPFRYDELSGLYNADSLFVGDTIVSAVGFASLGNNLVSAHVDWDTTSVYIWSRFSEDVKQVFLPQTDTLTLDFYFPAGYNYYGMPLYLIPKKAGSSALKLTVVSDSKYSPAEQALVLNISEKH